MTRLVLTNANLLDGDAPAQANRVVVIEGDRIASVSDAPPPDVTAADRVVDLGGRTVMPGMITCHYHSTYRELGSAPAPYGLEHAPAYQVLIAADNLRTALECGFTGAVGAGCSNDIDASMKRAIDDGLIPGTSLRTERARAQHDGSRERREPLVLGPAGVGRGPVLRRSRRVPRRGSRRDQTWRRDGEAVRDRWSRGEGAEVADGDDA